MRDVPKTVLVGRSLTVADDSVPVSTSTASTTTTDINIEVEDVVCAPGEKHLSVHQFDRMPAISKRSFIRGNFPSIEEKHLVLLANDFRLFSYLYNHCTPYDVTSNRGLADYVVKALKQ